MAFSRVDFLVLGLLAVLSSPVSGFWRMPCPNPLVVERADPLISPGHVSGHVHTVMGGNGFGFTEDYIQTQQSTCSSCPITKDLSNYWVPALYYHAENGSFINVEQAGGMTVYYLQRTDYVGQQLTAFPEGFRMVAGNPFQRNNSGTVEQDAVSFACLGTNTAETPMLPNYNCPDGLRAQVFFPSCWNGKDLDSPDHKSHVQYPSIYNAGICPEGTTRLISIFYEVIWQVDAFSDMWYGDSQPFVFSMGDATGYGYHGDFVNGWDVPTLQQAVNECTDDSGDMTKCTVFEFASNNDMNGCLLPSSVDEPVTGLLDALPGCNPIQDGPGLAVPLSDCDATTTISSPQQFFTDLTTTLNWQYIGCGTDPAGQSRTLDGPNQQANNMTVEGCVEFCSGQGYTYAGLEFSTQCFCGNDVASDRAPVAGITGACTMKCAGDDGEYCGGGATISLYQKCSETCQNVLISVLGNTTSVSSSSPSASSSPSSISSTLASSSTASATSMALTAASFAIMASSATSTSSITSASSITLPSGWSSAGCYIDTVNPRSLPQGPEWWGIPINSTNCAAYCDAQGYAFAGTENGGQCFCGDSLTGSTKAADTDCNMACEGGSSQTCGGSARLSLMTKGSIMKRAHMHSHGRFHRPAHVGV